MSTKTLEDRLRAVEDKLAIYHLIASHPPAADTGSDGYYRDAFMPDAVIDLGGGKAATGNEAIAAVVKTPEHQARHRRRTMPLRRPAARGTRRRQRGGDFLFAGADPEPRGEARGTFRARAVERLPHPPAGGQPVGSQAYRKWLEGRAARLSDAGWDGRRARNAASRRWAAALEAAAPSLISDARASCARRSRPDRPRRTRRAPVPRTVPTRAKPDQMCGTFGASEARSESVVIVLVS